MGSRARWTVTALCAAQFMLILDVVIINVAVPSIRADLGLRDSRVQLTAAAYTVTFGSLLIVSGRAGDLLGRRRMLLAGLTVFVAASILAGAAQSDWQLFAARGLQGVGAAMVSANALAAITASLAEGPERNWALGLWAGVGSAGAIAGQLVGGAVTQFLGWRWIFFINVPVGLVVVAVLALLVPHGSGKDRPRLDLAGALLLAGGLASAILALSWLAEDGARGWSLAAATAAAAALTAFALVERRQPAPVLRFALLRLPGVRAANLTLLLNAGALGATLFFLTLYLQVVLGYPPLAVGAAFAPITLLILLLSPRAARLTTRFGVRRLLTTGLALLAAGALLLARLPGDGDYWTDVLPGMLLLAFGSGLAYAPTYIAASTGVAARDQGAASGLINSAQEVGAAVGLAVLALVAAGFAGAGGAPAALAGGYRAGLVGAAALFAVAAAIALTVPRVLGRAAPSTEEAVATRG
ncbi:MFS transporter [Phytohabitans kaempferiae]|uniref:MFS transporter n=1 Tax=Phytohabitans kaempferiae TaxID=1620943 RepID=A0ABV6MHH1_9ACTN